MSADRAIKLVNEGQNVYRSFEDLAPYVLPKDTSNPSNNLQQVNSTYVDNVVVHDSTAITALNTLSNGLMSSVTSPSENWASISDDYVPAHIKGRFSKYASAVTKALLHSFQESNLYGPLSNFYKDLCSFGTAALYVGYGQNKMLFDRVTPGSYGFMVDHFGETIEFARELCFTKDQLLSFFKEDALPLVTGEDKYTVIHYIYKDPMTGEIVGKYIDRESKKVVQKKNFKSFPYIISRYEESSVTQWGLSPASYARHDILAINKLDGSMADLIDRIVDPPKVVTALSKNFNFGSGQINLTPDLRHAPAELTPQGQPSIGEVRIENLKMKINKYFHTDLFNKFSQLAEAGSSRRTQAEIASIKEEGVSSFTTTIYNLESTFVKPMVKRCYEVLVMNTKDIPKMDDELRDIILDKEGRLNAKYIQVTTSLRRAVEQRNLQAAFTTMELLGQLGGDSSILVNPMLVADLVKEAYNVPAIDIMHTEEEIAEIKQAQQQQQQLEQTAEMAKIQAFQQQSAK